MTDERFALQLSVDHEFLFADHILYIGITLTRT